MHGEEVRAGKEPTAGPDLGTFDATSISELRDLLRSSLATAAAKRYAIKYDAKYCITPAARGKSVGKKCI